MHIANKNSDMRKMHTHRNILLVLILMMAMCLDSGLTLGSNCKVNDCTSFCDYYGMGDMSERDYCIDKCHMNQVPCVTHRPEHFGNTPVEAYITFCHCD